MAQIKYYLNAPIIDNFKTLKEEAVKFLMSWYHDDKIWLDQPITINAKLINFITDLPLDGDWVEEPCPARKIYRVISKREELKRFTD